MRQAKMGDTVRVHYTGTLSDGTEFDSSPEHEPLELTIGSGQVICGIETALVGMSAGETKNTILQPKEAYGTHDPQNVHSVERDGIPDEVELEIGTVFEAEDSIGNQVHLQVLEFSNRRVTFDANHPLAGRTITIELNLVEFV